MQNIIKAMNELDYKPRAKWWGFVKDNKRYLCRYNHIFGVFTKDEILFVNYETRTDKTGVLFAVQYYKNNLPKITF